LAPRAVAAVSAGAAFACAVFGDKTPAVVESFKRRTADNPSNLHLRNLSRRRSPFPHHPMYRGTILDTTDASMLERLRAGPDIRVLLAHPPRRLPPVPAVLMGLGLYQADVWARRSLRPGLTRRFGFQPRVVSVRECETPEALADLILQSSCLPPLIPILRREGRCVVDGAIVDGVPIQLVEEFSSTLVLLTRRYRRLPRLPGVHFVQPSEPIPVAMWDYASPERIQAAFDLGRRDGESFARRADASATIGT